MPRTPNKKDYSDALPKGFEPFILIEDPRSGGNKKHLFGEVLFMVVTGVLCGMNGFAEIEEFCNEDIEWLRSGSNFPTESPVLRPFLTY